MSYSLRTNDEGALIFYPVELPMHVGNNSELGQQAITSLTSALRHMAVYQYADSIASDDDYATKEEADDHYAQCADRLISCMMSILAMADNMNLDINQRLMETL